MKKKRHCYLVRVQYLGFRYSGWQKQPGRKTVEGMLLKTLRYIKPNANFKILGSGRTDARVSAEAASFELFIGEHPITDERDFLQQMNANLPPDIRVVHMTGVASDFNVIQDVGEKEYHYFFSFGDKFHPFCAPFMANIADVLDIEKMIHAASMFEGTHHFKSYTSKQKKSTDYIRTVTHCKLGRNTLLTANFFPEISYVLIVRGKGFMRYQIRMIMGALIQLGRGERTTAELKASLEEDSEVVFSYVAPGSGLILHDVYFE
ncbi:MAG TPA: hypothetical protein VKN36_11335 [Eudoraea sp.]|nr:hypothetical protein [Eudoraea sp.]